MADGVIVGSAIVKRIASLQHDPAMIGHVAEFVRSLKSAMAACPVQPSTEEIPPLETVCYPDRRYDSCSAPVVEPTGLDVTRFIAKRTWITAIASRTSAKPWACTIPR